MKKFLTIGALALTLAVVSNQQASAWTNLKFSAGVNFGYQAGGNNFGWGLFRNGQPPETCCPTPAPGSYQAPAPAPYPGPSAPAPYGASFDQGANPTANVPAQTQSYRSWPNQTVNYQYPYPSYAYSYYYGYRPYYGNYR